MWGYYGKKKNVCPICGKKMSETIKIKRKKKWIKKILKDLLINFKIIKLVKNRRKETSYNDTKQNKPKYDWPWKKIFKIKIGIDTKK